MGSDITYRCLGPGSQPGSSVYEISFSFYRDCSGINVSPFTGEIDITNTCGLTNPNLTLTPIGPPTQITPICPTAQSTCNGGSYTGIEEWIYRGTVELPGECVNWTFSHSESARNNAITTISGAGGDILYVYSTVNNTNGMCDNSPTFSNKPVPFSCVGQRFCFNHGAYDVEGDSLVYQLITPRTGPDPNDTVDYLPNYSTFQPIISSPPMTFNSATGDFCMNPTQADVTVLAVLVSEYRNGILIGQVERDIQLTVNPCSNILPSLTGINGAPLFNINACADNQLCFYIGSLDPDASNNTTITWDQSIPGATFTPQGGHRDTAVFCWTPAKSDISATPYCFTATVTDDNCPYIGVQVYAYCIKVKGVIPDAGPDQTISCGMTTTLVGSTIGGNGNNFYTWLPSGIQDSILTNVGIGTYILQDSSAGCKNWDTVNVFPGLGVPSADFTFANNCSGTPVQFTDQSSVSGGTIDTWAWDFGDGSLIDNSQNPTHSFPANGTYNVTLTVTTPALCAATITQQVSINTNIPTAAFSASNACEGTATGFTDQSLGAPLSSWSWNFNDPGSGSNTSTLQNPSHTFSSAGNYNVTLLVTNSDGCQHQTQQNVTVNANPAITVSDAGMCENSSATLNGPSGYVTYSWSNGQSTQSINVNPSNTQSYILTVTDANGCTGRDTASVVVDPAPVPNAGSNQNICEGTSASLSGSGGTTYTWNPGNLSGPNVTVSPSGTTVYTLTVSSNAGCSAQATVMVSVNPMPTVVLDADLGICKGEQITLNSVTSSGSILWTPGNYTTQSITVSPIVTTTYKLQVSDAIGCSGSDSITVIVNEIPVAGISNPSPACGANSVQFNDASSISTGSIVNWIWTFGDGQTSTQKDPVTTYNNAGNFNVELIVNSDAGCKDTAYVVQTVWASPVAAYAHGNECDGIPINFIDGSTISDGSALSYNWDLGDNTTMSGTTFSHQYSTYGTYPVTLIVTSLNGCVDSIIQNVNVYPYPQAAFNLSYSCEDQPSMFTDNSVIPTGAVNAWSWTFGDNTSSADQNPLHTYSDPGSYNIHMVVSSDHGCKDSTDAVIRVVPKPIVDFTTENACLGYPVNLTDYSQPVTGNIIQYQWDFGDEQSSTDQNPQHVYNTSGWFQVSLTATTDSGCTTTLSRPNALNIYPLPVAFFSSNAAIADEIYPEVTFVNETNSPGFFYWHFGDGDTSTEFSPTHLYGDVGHYDVKLIATDMNGCIDSVLINIEIKPTSNVFIPNAFTPNGDTRNDFFEVFSYNVKDMDVQIYDRWGLKIVEWKGPKGHWDGKVNGSPAQADTYVYRVSTVDVNEKHEVHVGHFSLVR